MIIMIIESEMITMITESEMIIMKTECLKWLLWWQSVIWNYGNIYLFSRKEYLILSKTKNRILILEY